MSSHITPLRSQKVNGLFYQMRTNPQDHAVICIRYLQEILTHINRARERFSWIKRCLIGIKSFFLYGNCRRLNYIRDKKHQASTHLLNSLNNLNLDSSHLSLELAYLLYEYRLKLNMVLMEMPDTGDLSGHSEYIRLRTVFGKGGNTYTLLQTIIDPLIGLNVGKDIAHHSLLLQLSKNST